MSYAIIRNTNYKMTNLSGIYRHNERKNTNYSNKDINRRNSTKNYSIKTPYTTYEKMFKDIKKEHNLKGQIKKVSNVMCELIITSDKEFFKTIGEDETKRYFETAHKFVANYQNLGEDYIVSSKVHMDESTPHLHIIFVPVIHKIDSKSGKQIDKISCSEYWKGKDSYKRLQNNFYGYMTKSGFVLERGKSNNVEHISTEKLKQVTGYDNFKYELENDFEIDVIQEVNKKNLPMIVEQNKSLVVYTNKLKKYLAKSMKAIEKVSELENENNDLRQENTELKRENKRLKDYIDNTFEYVSILFDFSKERLHRLVDDFCNNLFKGR